MDYHFANSQDSLTTQTNNPTKKIIKTFLPIFALAAALPLFLLLVVGPQRLNFNPTKANQNELRVWFDPPTTVAEPGQQIKLKVFAENGNSDKLVYNLNANISDTSGLIISPKNVGYQEPFSGRVNLGEITVIARSTGNYSINILPENVTLNSEDLNIITSPATLEISNSIQ